MSDKDIEQEIQEKGLTAPRITRDDMIANIAHHEIVKHVSVTEQVLRWAIITTKNGFAVTGKPSCAVSSENDNEALGNRIALENAENELWPLMGYALKEKLSRQ
ncbi:Gp49 family protein [Enterobacter cloacae]|uniref:Gp49 family protein n=1 Tax=Enterobacter cloacae TaxID=550 RepID=UPI0021BF78F1|nr:Gp49 family protein [Enterobacter cloacae]UXL11244.1 Gp49 family protein [Enterobacter cloacae]UXL13151.1 Gp49 family protein [Enterobacter cloacae]